MSLSITFRAVNDPALRSRIEASVMKEAFAMQGTNEFADALIQGRAIIPTSMYWRVASDYTDAYETAVNSGRGAPGHDQDVITDGNISAAVIAVWPSDPTQPPIP